MSSLIAVADLARTIEHTLLSPTARPAQIEQLCAAALDHGFAGVCVNPCYVALARRTLGSALCVVSVVSFPLGASDARTAAFEAEHARAAGADELDLVAPLWLAAAGEFSAAARFVGEVRRAVPDATLKVILETGCFEPGTVRELAGAALDAGADYLKTSTGFGPRGASVEDVRLLAEVARGRARIKASGGIRTYEQAAALVLAGAARIGTSRGVEIVTAQSSAAG